MAGPSETQVHAYELQKVLRNVEVAFPSDHTFLDQIDEGKPEMVSNRNYWFPIDMLANGDFGQVDPDGGSYGLGGAIKAIPGQQTAVFFAKAFQYTDLMDWATDSSEKAVTSSPKRNIAMLLDQFQTNLESLALGPGDGSVDVLTATPPSGATVVSISNPNNFSDQQTIQIFPGQGQAARGAVAVQSVDVAAKQLYLTGAVPTGTQSGDLVAVKGASCVANSSLLGLRNQHADPGNIGTWNQIDRASYPGKLRTPHVAANGYALSPQMHQQLMAFMMRRTNTRNPFRKGAKYVMNVDMAAQWQNAGIVLTENLRQEFKGNNAQDQATAAAPTTLGTIPIQLSLSAEAQRVDLVMFSLWKKWMVRKLAPLSRGGQIFFGLPSLADGSMTSNTITYLVVGLNLSLTNPVAGGYMDGFPLTNNY